MSSAENTFYEFLWKIQNDGRLLPLPWWAQEYFRRWTDTYRAGPYSSKQDAFASNAFYRYWNMIGVKDHHQEILIGQAGEVEPVDDEYVVSFFLFDESTKEMHFPQYGTSGSTGPFLRQEWLIDCLPVLGTHYSVNGINVTETVLATTVGVDQKGIGLIRFDVAATAASPSLWLCLCVSALGPTGFVRRFVNVPSVEDRRLSFLRYDLKNASLEANRGLGPVFDTPPAHYGVYGNSSTDAGTYYVTNAYVDLRKNAHLNSATQATDYVTGLCHAAFCWPMSLTNVGDTFHLDVRLPIDDFSGAAYASLRSTHADALASANEKYWRGQIDETGIQMFLPAAASRFSNQFRLCRATLLMLSEKGAIHPGPTVYDSFWIRDSSVEGIACALAGDLNLPQRQFGQHYTDKTIFHQEQRQIGPVSSYGFFGGEHEERNKEWDSNGEALWALGRFDRVRGPAVGFGSKVFSPYVVSGARWLRDNRTTDGLLPSGWSAEHIGDANHRHYWDDYWAVAGLYEATALAKRVAAPQAQEIEDIYRAVSGATASSIESIVARQRAAGSWETFIPTGPDDPGKLDSTIIGSIAYFHPCRLYMGQKLGPQVDYAARMTLETIWSRFVKGGFRHDAAWDAFGSYLTLQIAHAFLLLGEIDRMRSCLSWALDTAAHAISQGGPGDGDGRPVVVGAWNEQHCYPVASNFLEFPSSAWWMGDIPHGWAAAEYNLLLRDMLLFEADEDHDRQLYVGAGLLPEWFGPHDRVTVSAAPTIYGANFGYELLHDGVRKNVTLDIATSIPGVGLVYPCRFGARVTSVVADGTTLPVSSTDVHLPSGTRHAEIAYG